VWIGVGVIVAGLIVISMLTPNSLEVSTAEATVGPLAVTVDEDGRTRAVDRYVITAPVAGELERLPLRAGERVSRGDVVARIRPLPLDERTRAQLSAAQDAARARERAATASLEQATAAATQAEREYERRRALTEAGALSAEQLEQFALAARSTAEQRDAARQALGAAQADVRAASAALLGGGRSMDGGGGGVAIAVRSPATGIIATVLERSGRIVNPGEVILEVTDASALEVVVDVLSTDAARIEPGMRTTLTGWGGPPLGATVRSVEPAAFTRLSALGVEEQRVNVILDLDDRPDALGDGYRVEASVTVWQGDSVLSVPSSAVFRDGSGWRVFTVADDRARLTRITIGERTGARTQVLAGLSSGDEVILFPSDELDDGTRVSADPSDERRAPGDDFVPSDTAGGVRP
jgi:HlyD family secretion protein